MSTIKKLETTQTVDGDVMQESTNVLLNGAGRTCLRQLLNEHIKLSVINGEGRRRLETYAAIVIPHKVAQRIGTIVNAVEDKKPNDYPQLLSEYVNAEWGWPCWIDPSDRLEPQYMKEDDRYRGWYIACGKTELIDEGLPLCRLGAATKLYDQLVALADQFPEDNLLNKFEKALDI